MRRIRKKSRLNVGRLTDGQQETLLLGFQFDAKAEPAFKSREDQEKAWKQHRAQLMEQTALFLRPATFWLFEGGGTHPSAAEQPDYLLRLKLALRDRERVLLLKELPPWAPDKIPSDPAVIKHWEQVRTGCATRAAWHETEGRPEQARLWSEQAAALQERLEAVKRGTT